MKSIRKASPASRFGLAGPAPAALHRLLHLVLPSSSPAPCLHRVPVILKRLDGKSAVSTDCTLRPLGAELRRIPRSYSGEGVIGRHQHHIAHSTAPFTQTDPSLSSNELGMERACFPVVPLYSGLHGRRWGARLVPAGSVSPAAPSPDCGSALETADGQTSICSIRKASTISPSILISWNFSKVMPHS